MNHLRARSHLSAFLDGELEGREREELSLHLESCSRCREEAEELRRLRDSLAALPRMALNEKGHDLLMSRVIEAVRERAKEEKRRRVAAIPSMATAAAVLLALLVVMVAVMTTPGSRRSVDREGERPGEAVSEGLGERDGGKFATSQGGTRSEDEGDRPATADSLSVRANELLASIPSPRLEYSGKEYSEEQVREYSADLGCRLDFFSSLWHPAPPGGEVIAAAKRRCRESLEEQAKRLGRDAKELLGALDSLEAVMGEGAARTVPCFVEEANYRGKRVYIISCSGPEDSILFTDADVISLVNLIRRSTPDGLMRSSEAQRQIAASLMPPSRFDMAQLLREGEMGEPQLEGCTLGDFQAILHMLAAENNLVSYLRELSRLDSGNLLSTLFQEVGTPLRIGSRLLDLLTMRVWVMDAENGEVLLRPSR